MNRVHLNINTEALRYARERARFSQEQLAKRLGIGLVRYRQFELGEAEPTIRQVAKIVKILNRSLQFFFLEEIPSEPEPLAELRRLPGSPFGEESPELAEQVQLASERREIALRLYKDLGEDPPKLKFSLDQSKDPEIAGTQIRSVLGITLEEQVSWSDEYEALRTWRAVLEASGVLVFQIPGVSLDEMRGFSFAFERLPIIGFNSRDWPRGRIFTVLHELVHILLDDTVLDSGADGWIHLEGDFPTEIYCNRVAAATLVPRADFESQLRLINSHMDVARTESELVRLSRRYQVSRSVILRRLLTVNAITESDFFQLRQNLESEVPDLPEPSGGDFYRNRLAHLGGLIPQLAYRAYYQDRATVSDLSLLFGMKAENLGKFEERVLGAVYGFRRV